MFSLEQKLIVWNNKPKIVAGSMEDKMAAEYMGNLEANNIALFNGSLCAFIGLDTTANKSMDIGLVQTCMRPDCLI